MRKFTFLFCFFAAHCLSAQQGFYVKFPDDINWTDCSLQLSDIRPEVFSPNGDSIVIEYNDASITWVDPSVCFRIERNWTVKKLNHNSQSLCITVPNPVPMTPDNQGAVVSPSGTPEPWTASFLPTSGTGMN